MLGYVALGEAAERPLIASPRDAVETRAGALTLWSERPPLDTGALLVCVEGVVSRVLDLPGFEGPLPESQERLVADLYGRLGPDFVQHLDGLFFALVFDRETGRCLLCNNRYQVTNLYYRQTAEGVLFGRLLTDVLRNLGRAPALHWGSTRAFLANGFTASDQTVVEGVRKLLPTFSLRIAAGEVALWNHWDRELDFDRRGFGDLEAHLDAYERVYRSGLSSYLERRRPAALGCLLSGGHDTSFAFLQASRVFGKPLHAFTATFPGWAFDEAKYAKAVCDRYGGVFHPVPFLPTHLDRVVSLVRATEEPVVSSSLALHLIAEEASRHVETMLGGDGGDTAWGEYYPVVEYHRWTRALPLAAHKALHRLAGAAVRATDWERFWELEHVAGLFAAEDRYADFMRRLLTYRHYSEPDLRALLRPETFVGETFSRSVLEIPVTAERFADDLIESKLLNGFHPYMPLYTTKSMAHYGLDIFLPTLDREVMRFITRLPMEWVNGGTTFQRLTNSKRINRRFHKAALRRHLGPDAVRNLSFDIPWHAILRPRTRVLELLLARLKRRGWFQDERLDRLFAEFQSQHVKPHELLELKHHGYRVFALLSLEVWCTEYLDGRMTADPDADLRLEDYFAS